MRTFKIILRTLLVMFGVIVIAVCAYLGFVLLSYNRIEDQYELTAEINQKAIQEGVELETVYTIATYNIGFGAYNREFSFFMDSGVMKDGRKVVGASATAESSDVVNANLNGAIEVINYYIPDFMFFQEVDLDSTRSYHINQYEILENAFTEYDSVMGINFHSVYLAYPLLDHHGEVKSGIATFSKYQIQESIRYSLPIDESFPNQFFDLDRCMTVSRVKVNDSDKYLVLINIHLSAYDEGGVYRALQLEVLTKILIAEKGNYVVVGGDFNHDIAHSADLFPTMQLTPEWVKIFPEDLLPDGYTIVTTNTNPTCRSSDIPYEEGVNYTVVLDGFIVSDNIAIESVENVTSIASEDVNFLYSDHNAVILKFKLKS